MIIRQAKIEDALIIAQAEQQIAKEPGIFCSQAAELNEENVTKTILALAEKGLYIVAELDGKIVGHAFLEPFNLLSLSHAADLNIAVHLGHQNKGIGKKLLEHLIEWAKNKTSLEKIQLNVRHTNNRAISLYKKLGFVEEGRLKNRVKIQDQYLDDIIMGLFIKNPPYHLEFHNNIPSEYETLLYQGLSEGAVQKKGLSSIKPFSIFIKDQSDQVRGGITGTHFYGSLYVDSLWLDSPLRHQGWGTKLMREAENLAREQGARFISLNTMDWEALPFYQKLGFSIEFTREGYEKDSKMFILRKNL